MRRSKKTVSIILLVLGVFILFLGWYKYTYSMKIAETYQVNSPDLDKKLLIATQGSQFKNTVTKGITDYYKSESIFMEVIDISSLNTMEVEKFDAIVVIHTWENWKPPRSVKEFIESAVNYRDKIVVMTTSGQGSYKMDNIDAITGESKLNYAPLITEKIILKLNPLLND